MIEITQTTECDICGLTLQRRLSSPAIPIEPVRPLIPSGWMAGTNGTMICHRHCVRVDGVDLRLGCSDDAVGLHPAFIVFDPMDKGTP